MRNFQQRFEKLKEQTKQAFKNKNPFNIAWPKTKNKPQTPEAVKTDSEIIQNNTEKIEKATLLTDVKVTTVHPAKTTPNRTS